MEGRIRRWKFRSTGGRSRKNRNSPCVTISWVTLSLAVKESEQPDMGESRMAHQAAFRGVRLACCVRPDLIEY